MYDSDQKRRAKKIRDYLNQTLDKTHAVVTGFAVTHPDPCFIYKGFIYTPVGTGHFDIGSHGINFITKRRAAEIIDVWKGLRYPPVEMPTLELIKNWKQYGCYENRVTEKQLVAKYLGDA